MVGKCLGNKIINADGFDKMCNNMLQYGMSCKNIAVKINEWGRSKSMDKKKVNKKTIKDSRELKPSVRKKLDQAEVALSKALREMRLG